MNKKSLILNSILILTPLGVGFCLVSQATSWVLVTIGIGAFFLSAYCARTYYPKLTTDIGISFPWSRWQQRFPWIADLLAIAVFALITVWLLTPCAKGKMPLSWDHPVHFLRFADFIQLLGQGKLSGWSDSWNQGYPLGEAYPPGANWWCSLFYLVTFGRLSLEATYAWAFLVFYALIGVSVYHFGKTLFNRSVGFLAGLICLLDIGGWRQGGYEYVVNIGVWTQSLGTVFALFAFSFLYRLLFSGRRVHLILCALAFGASVLCHPMCLVYYGIGLPIFFAVFLVGDKRRFFIILSLFALILGLMLAVFWLVPFFMNSEWFMKSGNLKWIKLDAIATRLIKGTLFIKTWPFLTWLGILGGILVFRRKHLQGIFLLCVVGALLVFASKDAFQKLDYAAISPSFKHLIYERVCILVKPFIFILASYAIHSLFELKPQNGSTWRHQVVVVALIMLAMSPFISPLFNSVKSFNRVKGKPILGSVLTKDTFGGWNDFRAFSEWARQEKAKTNEFYRIAFMAGGNNHFFACAPIYTGIPTYKIWTAAAPTFQGRLKNKKPETQKWWSIKYMVKPGKLTRKTVKLERTFGKLNVYRVSKYSPQRYTLKGPGKVKVEAFEPEYIKLVVTGASGKHRIMVHRSNYENWRATHNGNPTPIVNRKLNNRINLISVQAQNGVIEIWYNWPLKNLISSIISWCALGMLILIGIIPRLPRLRKSKLLEKLGTILKRR